jgi:hypothetical protein
MASFQITSLFAFDFDFDFALMLTDRGELTQTIGQGCLVQSSMPRRCRPLYHWQLAERLEPVVYISNAEIKQKLWEAL